MNWQIFLSTFVLIFVAELGDKTQLAAMARVASDASARWTIFLAASSALVISTLVAVLVGEALTRVIPARYIRMGAGVLFVACGVMIFREAFMEERQVQPPARTRGLSAFVLKQAAGFEKAAFDDYRLLAAKTQNPALRALLEAIAAEEDQHFRRISDVGHAQVDLGVGVEVESALAAPDKLARAVAGEDQPVVASAIAHELATARFYRELARLTPVPALKQAFWSLASAEEGHVARLKSFLSSEKA